MIAMMPEPYNIQNHNYLYFNKKHAVNGHES